MNKVSRLIFKQDGKWFLSQRVLIEGDYFQARITIELDLSTVHLEIINLSSGDEVYKQEGTSVPQLKKRAKKVLRQMGAKFYDEIKTPRKKLK